MKSAYELAMERLQKQSPSTPLTEDQKAQIAGIDSLYRSKMAEKELMLKEQIRREEQSGNAGEIEPLKRQLAGVKGGKAEGMTMTEVCKEFVLEPKLDGKLFEEIIEKHGVHLSGISISHFRIKGFDILCFRVDVVRRAAM